MNRLILAVAIATALLPSPLLATVLTDIGLALHAAMPLGVVTVIYGALLADLP